MCQVSHHEWWNLSLPHPIFSSLKLDPNHDQNPYLHPCRSPMPPPQAMALKPIWLGWQGRWWVLSDAKFLMSGCLGDLSCGSWTMMPSAPLQHYRHEKYCIRIIIFGWMYNWFLWKNLCTNFGIFWVSILLFLRLNILGLLFLCVHDQ